MERRKLLLVAVSVGIFLIIVIGASLLIFSPRPPVSPAAAGSVSETASFEKPKPFDASMAGGTAAGAFGAPLTPEAPVAALGPEPPEETMAAEDNVVYIYGENPAARSGRESATVRIERPSAPAVPDRSVPARTTVKAPARQVLSPTPTPAPAKKPAAAPAATAATAAPVKKPAAEPVKTAAVKPPARKSAPTAAAAGTVAGAAGTTPAKAYEDFWVQTGSFSTKIRAEGAKETLAAKGIAAIIESRDLEGKTFYRVRVGPYVSQKEADYWNSLIQEMGFTDSMIWQSPRM